MKDQKSPQQTTLRRYLAFYIRSSLHFQNTLCNLTKPFQILTIVICQIQILSFIELVEMPNGQHNSVALLQILCKICKPYVFTDQLNIYGYLVNVAVILIMIVLSIVNFYIYEHLVEDKQIQGIIIFDRHIASVHYWINTFIAYWECIFSYVLFVPLLELSMISIMQNSKSNDAISTVNLVISTIFMILLILYAFVNISIVNESLNITCRNLQKLNSSFADMIQLILQIVLICLVVFNLLSDTQFILVAVCNYINIILQLRNFITNYPTNLTYVIRWNIAMHTLVFTVTSVLIISFNSDTTHQTLLILILFPLLNYSTQETFTKQHRKAMQFSCKDDANSLQYVLSIKIYKSIDQNSLEIFDYISLSQHTKTCIKSGCFCQNTIYTYKIVIEYTCQLLVEYFGDAIRHGQNMIEKHTQYLHYIQAMNVLGLSTQAYQQSNLLLYQNTQLSSHSKLSDGPKIGAVKAQTIHSSSQSHSQVPQQVKQNKQLHKFLTGSISFIQKEKTILIQEAIKLSMSRGLKSSQQNNATALHHSVQLFLQSEENNKQLRTTVIQLINKKREFLIELQDKRSFDTARLYKKCNKLAKKVNYISKHLFMLYKQFPSQRLQALNAFVQAEVINNFLTSYKLTNVTTISDEQLLKMHRNMQINLFSNQTDYILTEFDKQSESLKIIEHSNLIHNVFGYTYEQFNKIKLIDVLLPDRFHHIHIELVHNFMVTSEARHFRQVELNFIKTKSGFIQPVDLFFDMNTLNLQQISFVVFLQSIQNQNAFILVNDKLKIIGITKSLFIKMGLSQRSNTFQNLRKRLQHLNINSLFPNFVEQVNEEKLGNSSDQDDFIQQIITEMRFYPEFTESPHTSLQKRYEQTDMGSLETYQTTMSVQVRHVSDMRYYVIELHEIKNTSLSRQVTDNQRKQTGEIFEESLLEASEEEGIVEPMAIVSEGFMLSNQGYEDKMGMKMQISKRINLISNENNQESSARQYNQPPLFSPKESFSTLLQNQNHSQFRQQDQSYIQQRFFVAQKQESQSQSYQASQQQEIEKEADVKSGNNKIQQIDLQDVDQDIRDNIAQQLQMNQLIDQNIVQIDDIGSQVSSLAGFRKTKYFKKYEILDRFQLSRNHPQIYTMFVAIALLNFMVILTYAILLIYNANDDFTRSVQEVTMVQLNSFFMGPYQKFQIGLLTSIAYQFSVFFFGNNPIQAEKDAQLINYQNNLTYYELKQNFNEQLINPYLQVFFTDQYIHVTQIGATGLVHQNITFKESLQFLLFYSYEFKHFFTTNAPFHPNNSYIVYFVSNRATFYDEFEKLSIQIYQYTIDRSQVVADKWISILVPFAILIGMLFIISWKLYRLYRAKYSQILMLFNYIDVNWLRKDILRLKIITELLMKDNNVIFQYHFDIDVKEQYLKSEELKKDQQLQQMVREVNKSHQEHSQHIFNPLFSFLLFASLYSVVLLIIMTINSESQNYFSSYRPSIKFLSLLADVNVAVCSSYATKEDSYINQDGGFFFIDLPHLEEVAIKQVTTNLETIFQFLQLMTEFQATTYLIESTFSEQFIEMQQQDVCNYLDDEYLAIARPYCDSMYEGVLLRGLQPTLTLFYNNLRSEMQINNFTSRPALPYRENEIAIIIVRVLNMFQQKFNISLEKVTLQVQDTITIVSYMLIIITLIIVVLLVTRITSYYKAEFMIAKEFIFLLPQTTLLLDNQFDRELRQFIVQNNLF